MDDEQAVSDETWVAPEYVTPEAKLAKVRSYIEGRPQFRRESVLALLADVMEISHEVALSRQSPARERDSVILQEIRRLRGLSRAKLNSETKNTKKNIT